MSQSVKAIEPSSAVWPEAPRAGRRLVLTYALLCVGILSLFLFELIWGTVAIPLTAVLRGLVTGAWADANWAAIVYELRLPRALTAMLAGAGLAASGLLLQTLFRNPLAGCWVLGVTAGAQVGVALVVVATGTLAFGFLNSIAWFSQLSLAAGAYLGAVTVMTLMAVAARRLNPIALIILGLMLGFLGGGLVNVLLHLTNEPQAKVYESWDTGSYGGVSWAQLPFLAALVLVGLSAAFVLSKQLNAFLLGENYARTLGLHVERSRVGVMAVVIALAGSVTAYCGPITFLDVIVPHICRSLFGSSDHRVLTPACLLVGALLGLLGDAIASSPWERHFLHVNAVNAVLGAPVVIWVIFRKKSLRFWDV
jgi:iron complex transport system permease protein